MENKAKSLVISDILPQLQSLIGDEKNLIANLANTSALIFSTRLWHWVGFYFVDESQHNLVLGPFQGPVACTRLRRDKGVCSKSWETAETVLVKDIDKFEGHIACSALTRSELVIPIFYNGKVKAVLDIDSIELDGFSQDDVAMFEEIGRVISDLWE